MRRIGEGGRTEEYLGRNQNGIGMEWILVALACAKILSLFSLEHVQNMPVEPLLEDLQVAPFIPIVFRENNGSTTGARFIPPHVPPPQKSNIMGSHSQWSREPQVEKCWGTTVIDLIVIVLVMDSTAVVFWL